MLDRFKSFWQGVMLAPFVNLFIRLGISPDAVTLVGTAGVSAGALIFFPRGELLAGVLFITVFIFSDLIDGAMARKTGRTSAFGAFFDSTLDRIGDAAIFGGLVLYFAGPGDELPLPVPGALLPGDGRGHVVRAGAGGVARPGGGGRDRRARGPHGRDPGRDRA